MTDFFTEDDCDSASWGLRASIDSPFEVKPDCISLKKANRLLRERGKVVVAHAERSAPATWVAELYQSADSTHQALIINIEEIEQDSAEKMLKDWLNLESGHADQFRDEERIRARAKALLRKGSGER